MNKRLTSATKIFAGVFFLNLACAACLTTITAFFDDGGSTEAYIIFGLNAFCSIFLIVYLLSCFLCSGSKDDKDPTSRLCGWTCWLTLISTVIIGGIIFAQLLFVTPKTSLVNWIMLGVVITAVLNFVVLFCFCCLSLAGAGKLERKPTPEELYMQRFYRNMEERNALAEKKKALGIDDIDDEEEEEDLDESEQIQLSPEQLESVLKKIFQNQAAASLAKYGITSDERSGGGGGFSFWDSD